MKRKILLGLLSLAATGVFAQDSTRTLDEVIVTATKTPIKQRETGKVINVITRQQLEKSSGKSLPEVLNQQPGLVINGAEGTPGTNPTIYMRGAGSSNTLILVDGIPLYDASGIGSEFDLNNFAVDNIEKIEILKGSQSTLYGSDAVAGVINIITRKGDNKPFSVRANLSAGSYNTYQGSVALSGTGKSGNSYFLSYNKTYSDGFSAAFDSTKSGNYDKDGFNKDVLELNYTFKPSEKTSFRLFGKYNNNKADIDAGAFTDDKDYTYHNKNTVAGAAFDYKLQNGFFRVQYNYNQYDRSFTDDSTDIGGFSTYQRGNYKSYSHFAELYTNLRLTEGVEFLAGMDYRNNSTTQLYMYLPDYGSPATGLGSDSVKSNQFSGYASLNVKAKKLFNIELGSRWNHHNLYGTNYTSSVNPFFLIDDHYKIYGSVSSGYRVPSLYQLYSQYGNKDLKPETTTSYEVGAQYLSKTFNARATGFIRDGQDVFFFYSDPVTYASQYINADKQHDYGVETEVAAKVSDKISFSANYTFVKGKITTNAAEGKDTSYFNLYKRPQNIVNLSVNYQPLKQVALSAGLKTVSKAFEPRYGGAPFELDGYYTVNFYGQYRFDERLTIFADLQNITDQKYFVTRGYNTKGFSAYGGVRFAL